MTDNPHVGVVVDLVDPYFTHAVKKTGQHKYVSPTTSRAIEWLRANPGRWAMMAEGSTGMTTGRPPAPRGCRRSSAFVRDSPSGWGTRA